MSTNVAETQPRELYSQHLALTGSLTCYVHSQVAHGLRVGDKLRRTSYVRSHATFGKVRGCRDAKDLLQLLQEDQRITTDSLRWHHPKFIGEAVAEQVRTTVNPLLPSHIDCNFAFHEPGFAAIFKNIYGHPNDHIFEVSVIGRWAQREMNLFNRVTGSFRIGGSISETSVLTAIEEASVLAARYWSGERCDPTMPEILIDGDVLVVRDLGKSVPMPNRTTLPENVG